MNNVADVYVATGGLLADTKPNAARMNLKGYVARQEFPMILNDKSSFQRVYDEDENSLAYADNPIQGGVVLDTAKNIYTHMQVVKGVTQDIFEEEDFIKALKIALSNHPGVAVIVNPINGRIFGGDERIFSLARRLGSIKNSRGW